MNLNKDFSDAFNQLKSNRLVVVPYFLWFLSVFALIGMVLYVSGAVAPVKEFIPYYEAYQEEYNPFNGTGNYSSFDYARDRGYDTTKLESLFDMNNLMLFLGFWLIIVIVNWYFAGMSLSAISLINKKKKLTLHSIMNYTNKFFLKYVGLKIIFVLIIYVPMIVVFFLLIAGIAIHPIVGGLMVIPLLLLYFIYLIFFAVRLLYITPTLYLENHGTIDSLNKGFQNTKRQFWNTFVVALIILVITMIGRSILGQPMQQSFWRIVIETNPAIIGISVAVFLISSILAAIALAYGDLFLFSSYKDMKKN